MPTHKVDCELSLHAPFPKALNKLISDPRLVMLGFIWSLATKFHDHVPKFTLAAQFIGLQVAFTYLQFTKYAGKSAYSSLFHKLVKSLSLGPSLWSQLLWEANQQVFGSCALMPCHSLFDKLVTCFLLVPYWLSNWESSWPQSNWRIFISPSQAP